MRTRLTLLLAAAALAALTGCSGQQPPPQSAAAVPGPTGEQPSEQDRTWMRAIHQANLTEVQAGRLAQGKATTKPIKEPPARTENSTEMPALLYAYNLM